MQKLHKTPQNNFQSGLAGWVTRSPSCKLFSVNFHAKRNDILKIAFLSLDSITILEKFCLASLFSHCSMPSVANTLPSNNIANAKLLFRFKIVYCYWFRTKYICSGQYCMGGGGVMWSHLICLSNTKKSTFPLLTHLHNKFCARIGRLTWEKSRG